MKALFIAFILMSGPLAFSGYQGCPAQWLKENPETYEVLFKMRGTHKVGNCQVELRLCNQKLPVTADEQVADILITHKSQEYYLPLYIDAKSPTTSSSLISFNRGIIFSIKDKNRDPLTGDSERDRLTMTLNYGKTEFIDVTLMRKTDYEYSKAVLWILPQIFSCEEKLDLKE